MGNMNSIKRNILRQRQANRLKEPASPQGLRIENGWTATGGQDQLPFVIHDSGVGARNRIVAFATEDDLRHLANSDTWFIDGNFSSARALFEQLFFVRAHLGESAVGYAYALLPCNTEEIYEEVLATVLDKGDELGLDFEPTATVTDSKQAIMYAVITSLFLPSKPEHMEKNPKSGLANSYKEEDANKHFCGMLGGLAFLPVDRVPDGLAFLTNNCPFVLEPLLEYFDATYANGTRRRLQRIPPLFPPER